ncbi:hypothetical protein N798_07235 [Knoellia flava TL1]|uniref:Methyltransferase domain-containing protein n=2 Tax=Knoellia flava TaxID=913969 RepID=A0A8H9FX26_9MICO|nr:bifunctional PIG-L family deacetylase/class I SAM-dependent methyltransferase [Knoellia flava]KGN32764.1 hypothetical protein N798_07235 [Knoellia flava TL1]GGB87910.1 hypothetical protein GCM10011314_29650 [Knoellia flava]
MSAADTPARLDHPDGEERWLRDDRWATVAHADARDVLTAYERLLVVAAHPDDECLGAGPLVADAADLGLDVVLLVLTDGEGSHPRSPTVGRSAMATRRRTEAQRSLAVLAPGARLLHAALPDGGLAPRHDDVVRAVRDLLDDRTLVLAPWTADGHPDHDAAGRAAADAVAVAVAEAPPGGPGPGLAHYLVWFWHWSEPDDLPWEAVLVVDGSLAGVQRASRAVEAHHTQVAALSPRPGDERLLTDEVLAPSRRGFTTLLLAGGTPRPSGRTRADEREAAFDAMFDGGDDPWSSDSWYERRKRDLTLAVLRRERYDRVVDVGCSTGALTRGLAARSDRVVGIDASSRALDVARRDTPEGVRWVHGRAPEVLERIGDENDAVDLVVLSEVLYFLTPFEVWLTLAATLLRLAPGGEVVLVDWRHPTEDIPLDGPAVHAQVRAALARWACVEHAERDVLIASYVVGEPGGSDVDDLRPAAAGSGAVTR